MATGTVIDATQCPLCRQANQCAMEIGKAHGVPPTACWCASLKIDAALLEPIPLASRGLACICQSCASRSVSFSDIPSTHPKDKHANVPH